MRQVLEPSIEELAKPYQPPIINREVSPKTVKLHGFRAVELDENLILYITEEELKKLLKASEPIRYFKYYILIDGTVQLSIGATIE